MKEMARQPEAALRRLTEINPQKFAPDRTPKLLFAPLRAYDARPGTLVAHLVGAEWCLAYPKVNRGELVASGPKASYSVDCGEKVAFLCFEWPLVVSWHEKRGIQAWDIETRKRGARAWPGECKALLINQTSMVLLIKEATIDCFSAAFSAPEDEMKILHIGSYKNPFPCRKYNIAKFSGNLLLLSLNNHFLLMNVANGSVCAEGASKDNSYFLYGKISIDRKVYLCTSSHLYIISVGERTNVVVVPLGSPIAVVLPHGDLVYCGCFDGTVRVLDSLGTYLYDLNVSLNSNASMDLIEKFTIGERISSMAIMEDFLITTSRSGNISVWSTTGRYQIIPTEHFSLPEGDYISECLVEKAAVTFLKWSPSEVWETGRWTPNSDKLRKRFQRNYVSGVVRLPTEMKKCKEIWKSERNAEFTARLQEMAARQYPFVSLAQEACLITGCLPAYPILFASREFEATTGFKAGELLGRSLFGLHGKYTDRKTMRTVAISLREARATSVQILNYGHDNKPLWCVFQVYPVVDVKMKVIAFLVIQQIMHTTPQKHKPPREWFTYEVALWVEEVGYGDYCQIFFRNKIDGKALLQLKVENMQAMGVTESDAREIMELLQGMLKEGAGGGPTPTALKLHLPGAAKQGSTSLSPPGRTPLLSQSSSSEEEEEPLILMRREMKKKRELSTSTRKKMDILTRKTPKGGQNIDELPPSRHSSPGISPTSSPKTPAKACAVRAPQEPPQRREPRPLVRNHSLPSLTKLPSIPEFSINNSFQAGHPNPYN